LVLFPKVRIVQTEERLSIHVLRALGVRADQDQVAVQPDRVIKFGTVQYLFLIAGLGFLSLTLAGLLVLACFRVIR
jgi:hypothetical protein